MRQLEKIWQNQTVHGWQNNAAQRSSDLRAG